MTVSTSSPPHRDLLQTLETELCSIASGTGCEVLHTSFRGGQLRVVLDHPDGVTLEHCAAVSRDLSAYLDVEDFGSGSYTLEVSSPGLDRPLYRPADYERFLGRTVRIRYDDPDSGRRTVVGRLDAVSDGIERIRVVEVGGNNHAGAVDTDVPTIDIHYDTIETARLEIEE